MTLFERGQRLQRAYEEVKSDIDTPGASAPDDIEKRVIEILSKRPTLRWDAAVEEVLEAVNGDDERDEG